MSFRYRYSLIAGLILLTSAFLLPVTALKAQTQTSGALSGAVTDPTGAAVPNARVTLLSVATGATRTTTTSSTGTYSFSLLSPGEYRLRVTANGFKTTDVGPVAVALSAVKTVNARLQVGAEVETIQVQAAPPLIETSNPNQTTTLTSRTLMTLPNPGEDLTYAALVAPGVVMNSQMGYSNFEVNGLPGTSVNFSIDGMYYNDPFLNLNNSGATNMSLGLNGMAEMSENSTSYAVDQGHLGAMQVNYITKSGTNAWHGNAAETWNGTSLNASNFFTNMTGSPKPPDTVNVFAASIGGPIIHNKAFFFVDFEGNRVAIPTVASNITYPTQGFEQMILNQTLPNGGTDVLTGSTYSGHPEEINAYKNMFALYGNPTGTPFPMQGCPLGNGGSAATPDGDGCAIQRTFPISSDTRETLLNTKENINIGNNNLTWYEFRYDRGVQATYIDPINTAFSAISTQPEVQAAAGWTHTFSPNLVMQFNPGFDWYTAIFKPTDLAKANALAPIDYPESPFGAPMFQPVGGEDFEWPQGRNVTSYQLIDNVTWSRGAHQFKFGANFYRVNVSDHDYGFYNTPYVGLSDLPQFMFGVSAYSQENFPITLSEPIAYVNLDTYAMDTWRVNSKLTLVYGIRATWDSTPVNKHNLVSTLASPFTALTTNPATPVNQLILDNKSLLYPGSPLIQWQPRASIAYMITPKTVLRVGAGLFSDVFPATVADNLTQNTPYDNGFTAGIFGSPALSSFGLGAFPGPAADSSVGAMVAANQAVVDNFSKGDPACAVGAPIVNCVPAGSFTGLPGKFINYPYSIQWSARIERQFGNNWAINIGYVGTRGVNFPYFQQVNGYQNVCAGCFKPYPFLSSAPNPIFGAVTQLEVGSNSNYNGLQTSVTKRFGNGLQFNVNYTYSKCLDTISNGGFLNFGNPGLQNESIINPLPNELYRNYGPCDYNTTNSLSANYLYQLPVHVQNRFLSKVTNGWEVSGTFFSHTGFPFTVLSSSYSANGLGIQNINGSTSGGPQFANRVSGMVPYDSHDVPGVTQPGQIQYLNPYAFQSVVDPSTGSCFGGDSPATCQFGDAGRNSLTAPGFFWADFSLGKDFKLSERFTFRVEGDFYNVLNHPNFNSPNNPTVGIPSEAGTLTSVGTINSEVSPSTGLLGSFLGGDSAVRMIALQAKLEF